MDKEKEKLPQKYILCRRVLDHHNEVLLAGPRAPSALGLIDFKTFITEHGLHPLEVAQFMKIEYQEIQLLVDNGGWIDKPSQENLLLLLSTFSLECRRNFYKFLINQEGSAGVVNAPPRPGSHPH